MKQLIDLLDQIAVASEGPPPGTLPAPRMPCAHATPATQRHAGDACRPAIAPRASPLRENRDVASTARAAIDAMRRGVIAYTTLTD